MLELIDQVDWASLSHAYGPADTPDRHGVLELVREYGLPTDVETLRTYATPSDHE